MMVRRIGDSLYTKTHGRTRNLKDKGGVKIEDTGRPSELI